MANKVTPLADRPLSNEKALARIQRLADKGGTITWASGLEETARDYGLDNNDLLNVINRGEVTGNRKVGGVWRYTVQGSAVEGEDLGYEIEMHGLLMVVRLILNPRGRITTE